MDTKDDKTAEQKPVNIQITDKQNKKLDFFITAPLRSADRLLNSYIEMTIFMRRRPMHGLAKMMLKNFFCTAYVKRSSNHALG